MPLYHLSKETLVDLRTIFLQSLELQQELGGTFNIKEKVIVEEPKRKKEKLITKEIIDLDNNENIKELIISNSDTSDENDELSQRIIINGKQKDTYTLCEVHDDVPFTFHCHPIEIDKKTKLPINIPNLISSEDLIGIVQDHYKNTGYLSNYNGQLMFDILLCPLGIFVYSSQRKIIDKWIELEDDLSLLTEKELLKLMKQLNPSFNNTLQKEKLLKNKEIFFSDLKYLIQHTQDENKNPYWASEENALMNNSFNKFIGSWYYLNRGKGWFAERIIPNFKTLGYQFWWSTTVDSLNNKLSNNKKNVKKKENANKKEQPKVVEILEEKKSLEIAEYTILEKQMEWFNSKDFLSLDFSKHDKMIKYLTEMREIGFFIEYFNWNCKEIMFTYEFQ
ncbi:hypothetical protein ABK040_008994 [Willaertia magna]